MKVARALVIVLGVLTLFMSALAGMLIAGIGPGSLERAVGALASAIAGCGLFLGGNAMLARRQ